MNILSLEKVIKKHTHTELLKNGSLYSLTNKCHSNLCIAKSKIFFLRFYKFWGLIIRVHVIFDGSCLEKQEGYLVSLWIFNCESVEHGHESQDYVAPGSHVFGKRNSFQLRPAGCHDDLLVA